MPRLPYIPAKDFADAYPELAARNEDAFSYLAHSLDGTRALLKLGIYIRDGSQLDPRLRELAVLEVARSLGSAYAFYNHIEIGQQRARLTDEDVDALIAGGKSSPLNQLERSVIAMARQMTKDIRVDQAVFGFLEQALGREQLVDLALLIGYYNNVVRVVACLEVDLESRHADRVRRFPI